MRKLYFLTLLLLCSATLSGQHKKKPLLDTVQVLPEVEIFQKVFKATALRMDVPIRFVPVPTNKVAERDLKIRQIVSLPEATKLLPAVRTRTTYGGYQQIYIRGFDYSPILIDGMRDERSAINNSYPFPDIAAAESIELVKGPASVLYGRSSEGGIINIVRKRPTDITTIDARISAGSWNDKRLNLGFGGKLVGPVKFYTNIYLSEKDGWRNTGDKRFSSYFALESEIGKDGLLELRGAFSRDHYGSENGLPPNMRWDVYDRKGEIYLHKGEMLPGLNMRTRYNIPDEYIKNRAANVMLQYTHKFSDNFKLFQKIGYFDDVIDYKNTSDMMYPSSDKDIFANSFYYITKQKNGSDKKTYLDLSSLYFNNPWFFGYIARTFTNQTEIHLNFNTGFVKHNVMLGYSYSIMNRNAFRGYNKYENNKTYGQSIYGSVYDVIMPINHPDNSNVDMMAAYRRLTATSDMAQGIYLNDLIEFGQRFKLMLSARYDDFAYRSYMDRRESDVMHFYIPDSDNSNWGKTKQKAFSYKAGAVYIMNNTFSFFGSMSSFYHPIRDLFNSNGIYINKDGNEFFPKDGGEVFKPESGYQAEIGTRVNYGKRFVLTASAFFTHKENVKKSLGTVMQGNIQKTIFGQVGVIEAKGFDMEANYMPSENVTLTSGYSFVSAQMKEVADNPYLKTEADKGLQLTDVPMNQFYARGLYAFQNGFLRNLSLFGTVTYMDKIYRDRGLNIVYPSFWQVNVGASYNLNKAISLTLNVYNLLDDLHYEQSIKTQMVPSDPRSFLITLSYKL